MLKIGCHLSSSAGYLAMGHEAVRLGANTFQFFTRNPRGGAVKPFDERDASDYNSFALQNGIDTILAHAPYTLNACAASEGLREFARGVMADDLARLAHIPGAMYNFHPGSHVGQGVQTGTELIAELLNTVLESDTGGVPVLLETMAGKGSEIGGAFAELRAVIDMVEKNERLGVCLDTCHVYDAGYDIVNALDMVLCEFDSRIGLNRLKAVHINDSKNPFSSHKDRHEVIGSGSLGTEALARVINHPSLRTLPFYLETPNDSEGYAREIALLKSLYSDTDAGQRKGSGN